jgi:tetratricopeptide (TPR) repeat protein
MAGPGGWETRNTISGGIFFSAVVQGRDITVQLPPEVTPALSGLPMGTSAFAGRDVELRTVLDILAPNPAGAGDRVQTSLLSSASTVVAVTGLAGIGKTELAIQAAQTALDRGWFPGGVLFVDLFGYDPDRSLEPGQALEGFLHALAVPSEHIPPQTQDRGRLYSSVLAAYAREGRRILVVIDNAASHEQAKPLLPADPASTAIVTSRDTLGLLDARLIELDPLALDAAADMLDRVLRVIHPDDTRITDNPGDALGIAGLCEGLPLALRIIAAQLSENLDRPLASMATDLENEPSRLDELSYADLAVRKAFDLSYQRLNADRARLFRLLPVNPGPEISTQAAARLADVDEPVARRGLEALARAHMVNEGLSYGRWRMLDLLRLYARQLADAHADVDGREQARDRLLVNYLEMTRAANAHLRALPGMQVPATFAGREKALAWLDAERPSLVAAVTMAASTGRDQIAMRLPLNLGPYLEWRRRFDDLLSVTMVSRDAARHLKDRGNEASALNLYGGALREVFRLDEAIAACQESVAIYREIGNRHSEGIALGNLGSVLTQARQFEKAIAAYQKAAATFREIGDRHGEGMALDGRGVALRELGRSEEAIAAHQEAAAIFQLTGDRLDGTLSNLGLALREAGRFEEAIAASQEAAAISRETGNRHGEGLALSNSGIALRELGRFEEAIAACQEAAAIFRELGDRHGEGLALGNLGSALRGAGRFEDAIAAHQEAAAIFRETGDRHSEGLALDSVESHRTAQQSKDGSKVHVNDQADIGKGARLGQLGRPEEAIAVYDQVISRFGGDTEPGPREQVAVAMIGKGVTLGQLGRPEEEIAVYDQVISRFGGDTEPGPREQAAGAMVNKGLTLTKLGRAEEAVGAYDQVIDRFGGDTEPAVRALVARSMLSKGVRLGQLGRPEEAIGVYDQSVSRFGVDTEPAVRELVATAMVNEGIALSKLGRPGEAIGTYDQVMDRFGGDTEPSIREQTAKAMVNKGARLIELGRPEEAIGTYDQVADWFGGDTEPAVREQAAGAIVSKGITQSKLGRAEEAVEAYDQVIDRFGMDTEPAVREETARAMVGKGMTLDQLGRPEEAAGVYDQVADRFGEDTEPALRYLVVNALKLKARIEGQS